MNKVILSGRVASDVEIKEIGDDNKKASFRFAVPNRRKKDDTNFFNVEAWGKTAELLSQFAVKGKFLLIEGRLDQHTWKTEDGQNRERILVVADNFDFGPKEASDGDEASTGSNKATEKDDDPIF